MPCVIKSSPSGSFFAALAAGVFGSNAPSGKCPPAEGRAGLAEVFLLTNASPHGAAAGLLLVCKRAVRRLMRGNVATTGLSECFGNNVCR